MPKICPKFRISKPVQEQFFGYQVQYTAKIKTISYTLTRMCLILFNKLSLSHFYLEMTLE